MSQVFRQKPMAPDELLGRVETDGKVYASRFGPDKYIGRVEVSSGKIYESQLGPDRYLGRVELDSGKVFRHKPAAPDEYVGRVDKDGRCQHHKPLASDEYMGKIAQMASFAHGGAAFLLLVLPAWEEVQPPAAKTTEGTEGEE